MKLRKKILCPGFIFVLINIFALIIYLLTPKSFFIFHLRGAAKRYSNFSLFFYCLNILLFFLGTQLGFRLKTISSLNLDNVLSNKKKKLRLIKVTKRTAWFLLGLQLLWIFYATVKSGGQLINEFLLFKVIMLKKILYSHNLPGLTTLTLLSGTVVILYSIIFFSEKIKKRRKIKDYKFWIVIFTPSILRGIFFAERLAIIENFIILFIMYVYYFIFKSKKFRKKIKIFYKKSFTFAVSGVVLFVFAESKRSFLSYQSQGITNNSIFWGLSRLMMYFSSSINTGLVIIEKHKEFNFPSNILMFIYKKIMSPPSHNLGYYLINYGSVEYNTSSGIGAIFLDLRYFSIIFIFIMGVIVGNIYKSFLKNKILGLLIYPLIVPGLIDSYRLYYFGDIRFILPVGYSLLIVKYLEKVK